MDEQKSFEISVAIDSAALGYFVQSSSLMELSEIDGFKERILRFVEKAEGVVDRMSPEPKNVEMIDFILKRNGF